MEILTHKVELYLTEKQRDEMYLRGFWRVLESKTRLRPTPDPHVSIEKERINIFRDVLRDALPVPFWYFYTWFLISRLHIHGPDGSARSLFF